MLLNLSEALNPITGVYLTKDEFYAKIQDIAEAYKSSLPRNINFTNKIKKIIQDLNLVSTVGDQILYEPSHIIYDDGIHNKYYLTTEYVILDYAFNVGLKVNIFEVSSDFYLGHYICDHTELRKAYQVVKNSNKFFLIYCPSVSSLRVMSLPDCLDQDIKDLSSPDFVYHDIYVPYGTVKNSKEFYSGTFGFVSGHYIGDDSNLSIEYLDLSEFQSGKIMRQNRFGSIAMPRTISLADAIDLQGFNPRLTDTELSDTISIAVRKTFKVSKHIGRRERFKNLKILRWVCPNKGCNGQGERVINPDAEAEQFRCHCCFEIVHDVKNNILIYDPHLIG